MKTRSLIIPLSLLCLIIPGLSCSAQKIKIPESMMKLKDEVYSNLTGNILPYWSGKMVDRINGGFVGRIDGNEKIWPDADKGGILNARILWTWSAAYRVLGDTSYLRLANRAKDYIYKYFIDKKYGGAFMSVKPGGEPADTRKQVYTNSFFIYALAEYSRATGDKEALEKAKDIYKCVEKYASDTLSGGYFEVFTRDWQRSRDRIIGEKSDRDEKTMNTHLHLLESYTNLYRIWPDKKLEERLRKIVSLFENRIIDSKTSHLIPFLERNWVKTSDSFSFGHDIEFSWLLYETAAVLGDPDLKKRISAICLKIADAAADGLQPDGSMATEKEPLTGVVTSIRSWWEQSETVVGYLNAWEISGIELYLDHALRCWRYIKDHFVDNQNGGWYSHVDASGNPMINDKAGFWICPYHCSRMCLEVIERVKTSHEAK